MNNTVVRLDLKRKPRAVTLQKDPPKLLCAFCGKSEQEVQKLIPGPNVHICNECIECGVMILLTEEPYSSITTLDSLLTTASMFQELPEELRTTLTPDSAAVGLMVHLTRVCQSGVSFAELIDALRRLETIDRT